MNNASSLSHTRRECKYHIVWISKCRRKVPVGQLRNYLEKVFSLILFGFKRNSVENSVIVGWRSVQGQFLNSNESAAIHGPSNPGLLSFI